MIDKLNPKIVDGITYTGAILLTITQIEQVLAIIQCVVTILLILFDLYLKIRVKLKEAKKDGKITKDELTDIVDDVKSTLEDVSEIIDDKEKDKNERDPKD